MDTIFASCKFLTCQEFIILSLVKFTIRSHINLGKNNAFKMLNMALGIKNPSHSIVARNPLQHFNHRFQGTMAYKCTSGETPLQECALE